jgi:hypothetical protein
VCVCVSVFVFFWFWWSGFLLAANRSWFVVFSLPCCRLRWFSAGLDITRVGL